MEMPVDPNTTATSDTESTTIIGGETVEQTIAPPPRVKMHQTDRDVKFAEFIIEKGTTATMPIGKSRLFKQFCDETGCMANLRSYDDRFYVILNLICTSSHPLELKARALFLASGPVLDPKFLKETEKWAEMTLDDDKRITSFRLKGGPCLFEGKHRVLKRSEHEKGKAFVYGTRKFRFGSAGSVNRTNRPTTSSFLPYDGPTLMSLLHPSTSNPTSFYTSMSPQREEENLPSPVENPMEDPFEDRKPEILEEFEVKKEIVDPEEDSKEPLAKMARITDSSGPNLYSNFLRGIHFLLLEYAQLVKKGGQMYKRMCIEAEETGFGKNLTPEIMTTHLKVCLGRVLSLDPNSDGPLITVDQFLKDCKFVPFCFGPELEGTILEMIEGFGEDLERNGFNMQNKIPLKPVFHEFGQIIAQLEACARQ